jgi:phosphatidylinositol-3-phosphatase
VIAGRPLRAASALLVMFAPFVLGACVPPAHVCGNAGAPLARQKVVVFAFENRTWSDVGGTKFQSMPYLHSLALQCSTFASDTEVDTSQNSATQYVGTTQGSENNSVRNDCSPSSTCESLADNVFRQARRAGEAPRSYVEGASTACSSSGNAVKHIPALYFRGSYADSTGTHNDQAFCRTEVVPLSSFDPNNVPAFSFVTPTLCDDGHDCGNAAVDSWAKAHIQAVINSAAYQRGRVTIFVWYDEDHPVPNMQIGWHARAGVKTTPINDASTLRAWEDMLGVPHLANAQTATGLRLIANI